MSKPCRGLKYTIIPIDDVFPPPPLQHCSSPSSVSTWLLFLALLSPGLWWHVFLVWLSQQQEHLATWRSMQHTKSNKQEDSVAEWVYDLTLKGGKIQELAKKSTLHSCHKILIMAETLNEASKKSLPQNYNVFFIGSKSFPLWLIDVNPNPKEH